MGRIRALAVTVFCALVCAATPAFAQTKGHKGDHAIPVDELPPIPLVVSDEDKIKSVTVVGATLAEEDVVVGAAKREQSLGSVASAVTVLTADRLRRFGYRSLAEALRAVVGLYIVDDRNTTRLGIRGVQLMGDRNTRILVLIDGSPINEPWQQGVDTAFALPIHIDNVARIEIIRGPVSSVYGTNAFLGIINIISLQADRAPRAYARTGIASHGDDVTLSGDAGFSTGGLNRQLRGFFAWRNATGETITIPPFGELNNTNAKVDADALSAYSGGLVAHYDRLFVQLRAHRHRRELPGAPYDSNVNDPDNANFEQQLLAEVGYTRDLSRDATVAARAYVNRYRYEGDLSYAPFPDFRAVGTAVWYGAEVRGLFHLKRYVPHLHRLNLTAGVATEFTRTNSRSFEADNKDNAIVLDQNFNIQGVYTEVDAAPTRWLSLTAGVRLDLNSIFEHNFSPRGALFFTPSRRYGAKLLYAQGFRNPSVFEAFYADERRFLPAGSTLLPEQIDSIEGVVWGRPLPGLKVRVSAWRWNMDKIIEKVRVLDPTRLTEALQFQNIFVGVRSRGFEVETSYRDTTGWLGFASSTFSFVNRGDERANNAPIFTGSIGGSTPRLFDLFHLSSEAMITSSRINQRQDDASVRERLDAFILWNAVVYIPDYKGFDLTLGARNILGTQEQVPAANDYDRKETTTPPQPEKRILTIPGPSRELFVRVGYRF